MFNGLPVRLWTRVTFLKLSKIWRGWKVIMQRCLRKIKKKRGCTALASLRRSKKSLYPKLSSTRDEMILLPCILLSREEVIIRSPCDSSTYTSRGCLENRRSSTTRTMQTLLPRRQLSVTSALGICSAFLP